MKKIYLLFISLSLYQITSAQQWMFTGSTFTGQVRGLFFENPDTGYAVGRDSSGIGQIAKTIDGGVTWITTPINQSTFLRAISFVNKDTGFVCGVNTATHYGLVLKTEDGGSNWTVILSDTLQYFRAVDFISPQIGFLGGAAGTILKTVDGGNSWTTDSIGEDTSDVIQLHMVDSGTGYAVCASSSDPYNPGFVFKTSDGGATWDTVYYNANSGLLGLAVVDALTAYAGGVNQMIIKTADGGATWDTIYSGLPNTIRAGFAISPDKIYMVDDGYTQSNILNTNDGGTTWTIDTLIGPGGFFSIHFPTPSVGYTGDLHGSVYKTEICQTIPSIDSISGAELVCQGDTMLYSIDTVAGATSYSWIVPNGAVITGGNGSTSIIVLFGDSSGNILVVAADYCDTSFAFLGVIVNALPDTPTITFTNDTLMSSSATTYQWYYNGSIIPGATDQTYSPTQDGFYTVTITNGVDCETTSLPFPVIGLSVGEGAGNMRLQIFPNPLSTSAVISIMGNSSQQYLSIADVQGKILRQIPVSQNQKITLDKKDFAEGMYFISLLNEHHELIARSKLVVQ